MAVVDETFNFYKQGTQDVVCKSALVDEHPSQNLPYGGNHTLTCTIHMRGCWRVKGQVKVKSGTKLVKKVEVMLFKNAA